MDSETKVGSSSVIGSRVCYGDKVYRVSTINRESSAMYAYGARYNETLVFDAHDDKIVFQAEDSTGSIRRHFEICALIIERGLFEEPESGDDIDV